MNQDTSIYSADAEEWLWQPNGQASAALATAKLSPTAADCLKNDSPVNPTSETCESLSNGQTSDMFPSLPAVPLVSPFPLQDESLVRRTIAISGRQCLALSDVTGPIGALSRTLLTSQTWFSPHGRMTWRLQAINRKGSIFRLVLLDYQAWNGTSGLLPRPMSSDFHGTVPMAFRGSDWQNGGKHGNRSSGGRLKMAVREKESDGKHLNPRFSEAVKGLPISWTESEPSATPSRHLSRSKSSKPSDNK